MDQKLNLFDWNWRRRPLFWAALLISGVLAVWRPDVVARDDLSRCIGDSSGTVYVAGLVDSEIETHENGFGGQTVSFVLAARKFWKDAADPGRPASGKVRVSMHAGEDLRYGDLVGLSGDLRAPRGLRNPGGFDQKAWLARQGIRSLFYAGREERFKILGRGLTNPVLAKILAFKAACLEKIRQTYSKRDAPILSALFFGVRSEIDDEIKDRFLKTGTLHLLAVSGFNVGFVITAIFLLLKPFRIHRPVRLALGLTAAWIYVLLVGPQSPVFRAGVMVSVWLVGEILGRRSDALNSLGLSAMILWALRPLDLFDPGFQLSYAAVIGIVVAVPHLAPRPELFPGESLSIKEKMWRETQLLFWTSFAAQAATLPVSVAHFYVVTPWSVFANVPAGFLVFVLFMAGAVQLLLSFLFAPLAAPAAWVVHELLALLLGILAGFERLPFALWTTGKLSIPILLILTIAACVFIFGGRGKTPVRAAALIAVVIFCFAAQEMTRFFDHSFRATILDVGQGDAIHLRFPDGSNWLVDAGQGRAPDMGRTVLIPYLRHEGVHRLGRVLVTHPQEDHLGGLSSLIREIPIGRYSDPGEPYKSAHYRRILGDLSKQKVPIVPARAGETQTFSGGVRTEILAAGLPPGAKNINDASVILRAEGSPGSLLLTGDAGELAFARLLEFAPRLHANVLKVPHHGARPGPEERAFLEAVSPSASIISVGERNRYGHPRSEALAALASVPGNRVYRTDRSGAVRVLFGGKGNPYS